MIQDQQAQHVIQATVKAAPAIAPGAATMIASWMGFFETGLSILLLFLSIAFLLWRWRVAYLKEER